MNQIFESIPNCEIVCHFVLALKKLYGYRSQILHDANNELLNTHNISIDSQCVSRKFYVKYKKWLIPVDSIVYL